MKKIILALFFTGLFFSTVHSQDNTFRLEASWGFTTGEAADVAGFTLGANASYYFGIFEGLYLGPLVGVQYSMAQLDDEEAGIEGMDLTFVPLAASADIRPFPSARWFSVGGDVGHAQSLNDEIEGGFFYRPRLGFEWIRGSLFTFSYSVIELGEETNFTNWNMGLVFSL